MYTIIGGDGKEYGPVTADQIRAWIAGGRANLDTKVKALGTDEWKRIADFPELAGSGAAGAAPPPPSVWTARRRATRRPDARPIERSPWAKSSCRRDRTTPRPTARRAGRDAGGWSSGPPPR